MIGYVHSSVEETSEKDNTETNLCSILCRSWNCQKLNYTKTSMIHSFLTYLHCLFGIFSAIRGMSYEKSALLSAIGMLSVDIVFAALIARA